MFKDKKWPRELGIGPPQAAWRGAVEHPSGGGPSVCAGESGADIAFLSAFPAEREVLFPPLTYLQPTGRKEVLEFGEGAKCTVVEVSVRFPS